MSKVNFKIEHLRRRPITSLSLHSDISNKLLPHAILISFNSAHDRKDELFLKIKSQFNTTLPAMSMLHTIAQTNLAIIPDPDQFSDLLKLLLDNSCLTQDEYARFCAKLPAVYENICDLKQQTMRISMPSEAIIRSLLEDQICALLEECENPEAYYRAIRTAFSYYSNDETKIDKKYFPGTHTDSIIESIDYCSKIFSGDANLQSSFARMENIPNIQTIKEIGYQMTLVELYKMATFSAIDPKQRSLMILAVLIYKSFSPPGMKGFSDRQLAIIVSGRFIPADAGLLPLLEKTLLDKKIPDSLCADTSYKKVLSLFHRACDDAQLTAPEKDALYSSFMITQPTRKWANGEQRNQIYLDLDRITDTSFAKGQSRLLKNTTHQEKASKYGWELYVIGASMSLLLCLKEPEYAQFLIDAWTMAEDSRATAEIKHRKASEIQTTDPKDTIEKYPVLSLTFPIGHVPWVINEVAEALSKQPATLLP